MPRRKNYPTVHSSAVNLVLSRTQTSKSIRHQKEKGHIRCGSSAALRANNSEVAARAREPDDLALCSRGPGSKCRLSPLGDVQLARNRARRKTADGHKESLAATKNPALGGVICWLLVFVCQTFFLSLAAMPVRPKSRSASVLYLAPDS